MAGVWVGAEELMKVGKEIAQARGEALVRLKWRGEKIHASSYLPSLVQLVEREGPSVILFPSRIDMDELGAQLAWTLQCPFLSGCTALRYVAEEACLEAERLIYGGAAVQVLRHETWPVIVSLSGGGPLEEEEVEWREIFPASGASVEILERRVKETAGRPITEAKVVISVGRGLKNREDLAMIGELAKALEGEIGCSRPLASELHWLPESSCIGLSGAQVSPELYLALGVSGQVQHVVGMRGAGVVVAVNKDEKAPIFEVADFGIVGDLYRFIPLFLEALQEKK